MTIESLQRRRLLQAGLAATVPFGLLACSDRKQGPLLVGGLPVTCNLTLPVACVARDTANKAAAGQAPALQYTYSKFNGWPEIKESLMTGRIQAAFMLAPLVMSFLAQRVMAGGMDSSQLGNALGQEKANVQQQGGIGGGILGSLLDQDGDGQVGLSDLMKIGGGLLNNRR